jgi:hypothetical protein
LGLAMSPGDYQNSAAEHEYILRVSQDGEMRIQEVISVMHGRVITLLAVEGAKHCVEFPGHREFLMGRIALEIEAALQPKISSHSEWLALCDTAGEVIQVELQVIWNTQGAMVDVFAGGIGGAGAMFGAGGGGGGAGLLIGGAGGCGAAGAAILFHIAHDSSLLDIDAFVTPGKFEAAVRPDTHSIKVALVGGGGGGGSGAPLVEIAGPRGFQPDS